MIRARGGRVDGWQATRPPGRQRPVGSASTTTIRVPITPTGATRHDDATGQRYSKADNQQCRRNTLDCTMSVSFWARGCHDVTISLFLVTRKIVAGERDFHVARMQLNVTPISCLRGGGPLHSTNLSGARASQQSIGSGFAAIPAPPRCRTTPLTAFSAVVTAPSAQPAVHEMSSPARKMPR